MLLISAFSLALAACGGGGDEEEPAQAAEDADRVSALAIAGSTQAGPPGDWVKVASEGSRFTLATATTVAYGADTRWVQKRLSGAVKCSNATFGDPAYGVHKMCLVPAGLSTPAPAPAPAPGTPAPCTQTLNPGANVAQAVSAAAAGATICLNAGSYGSVALNNIAKTKVVTLRSTSDRGARLRVDIGGTTNRITLDSLTLTGSYLQGKPANITYRNSTFTGQLVLRMDGNSNANIVVERSTFDGISVCSSCYEGRLQVQGGSYPVGVTIRHNHFGGAGESDGIQLGAPGVVVGPGNVFDGIVQARYGRHVDAIQGYGQSRTTITGNYFVRGDTYLMFPDGGSGEVITHNVFDGGSRGNNGIQLGSHSNGQFLHNTVRNVAINMDKKVENPTPTRNAVARHNVLIGTTFKTVDSNGTPACTGCSFDSNLFGEGAGPKGTNALVATPLFTGGAAPTTWVGWQLQPASPGYKAGDNGSDYGPAAFGGN